MAGQAENTPVDVAIIGAGFAGLYALHVLRNQGKSTRVIEAASDVGGTWFWNRYPGARCDVESLDYSYSFSNDIQQEWRWSERYATQPEILEYINFVADKLDLKKDITFNTQVVSAIFDDARSLWNIETSTGEKIQARFCIMATGNLSLPRVPEFPGLEDFKGEWYHTGTWPHEGVDFSGKRVGLIGTGSSGMQLTPIVAEQAKEFHVFQRTANYALPAGNRPLPQEFVEAYVKDYPKKREYAIKTPVGVASFVFPEKSALEDDEAVLREKCEFFWNDGGGNVTMLSAYTDIMTNKEANERLGKFIRDKIRSIVKDPATAELLTPNDHYLGTKRLPLVSDYFETFNRPNVRLINVRKDPITRLTETGLETENAHYELDAIVFATGFDAMTGALQDIDICGVGGVSLRDKWKDGPRTLLGLMTAGFPNMFIVTGPGSPSVKTNMVIHIEQHVEWICECIDYLQNRGLKRIDPDKQHEDDWVEHVNQVGDSTLFPLANSWYTGANIPGKPRVFMPYVAGFHVYREKCNQVAEQGYKGFALA